MDFIPLTVAEAIEACIEYGENSEFSPVQRAFVHKKTGWGSPRAIYKALHDRLPAESRPFPRVENHAYRGKPYQFKLHQLRDAIACGALKVEARRLPIKEVRHIRLDPTEAAHLEYNAGENSGQYGEIRYADLRFYPSECTPELVRTGSGQSSRNGRERVKLLHETNRRFIRNGMTQRAYAGLLMDAARKQRQDMTGLSLKSIQRHLEYFGVLTKRSSQKS